MKKFIYVGKHNPYYFTKLKYGLICEGKFRPPYCAHNIEWYANEFPDDWIEVFESDMSQITLHKDTDLGYFAGLFASSGWKYEEAIQYAKELIDLLNKENGRK
jgi:hypothetical protein